MFSEKNYTADRNFTRPPVATVATNSKSALNIGLNIELNIDLNICLNIGLKVVTFEVSTNDGEGKEHLDIRTWVQMTGDLP